MSERTHRQPAHLEQVGGKSNRQRIWEAIRARRHDFTLPDIAVAVSHADPTTIRTYLRSLDKAGFIVQTNAKRGGHERKRYALVRDNGIEAPRLTRDGQPVVQGLGNECMWRTMRMIKSFSARELAAYASSQQSTVSEETASSYIKALRAAGYLRVVSETRSVMGAGKSAGRYALIPARNTGPRPPMIQRTKSVYDPNLGEVVWRQEVNHDDL